MSKQRSRTSDARQRLVETAERLFYAEGIRAVGIDRIIAEAGVAKMSLYHHFASKEELILAVLQFRAERVHALFQQSMDGYVAQGQDRLMAFFAALKDWFDTPGFRGCAFLNTRAELADGSHPACQFAARHKVEFHRMLHGILADTTTLAIADAVAPAVALLVEGAIVMAVMEASSRPAETAKQAAIALVGRATSR